MQLYVGTWNIYSKAVLITVVFLSMFKSFFFMRIFAEFSAIVMRIINVISGLGSFLLFYLILVYMFSMAFNVFGPIEAAEYKNIGYFFGGIFYSLRFSVGDFDFSPALSKYSSMNAIFFIVWLILSFLSVFIVLNFLIAQVTEVYQEFQAKTEAIIMKERASLLVESEETLPSFKATAINFPRYIIVRDKDE